MNKNKSHIIGAVLPESIADELGIEPGDELLEINNEKITDIFDYQFLVHDEHLDVLIRKTDGEDNTSDAARTCPI